MFRSLQEYYSREFLEQSPASLQRARGMPRRPGGEATVMARDEQRRARDWADKQSLQIARELLEKRLCVDCHVVTKVPGKVRLRAVAAQAGEV